MRKAFQVRYDTCDICLSYSDVSGEHAILQRVSTGEIAITDNHSTNGTFVNGERISYKVLHQGDIVTISKGHTLDWASQFPNVKSVPEKQKEQNSHRTLKLVAVIVAVFILLGAGAGVYFWKQSDSKMTPEEIYKQYNSAVCMLYGRYAYTISLDSQDKKLASEAMDLLGIDPNAYYTFNAYGGLNVNEPTEYTGTGFFITEDGKLGTNLHVVKPWLFKDEADILEAYVRQQLALYSAQFSILNSLIPDIKVTGHLLYLGVIPNGLPFREGNLTECISFSAGDNKEKDVAIVQTVTHNLPNGVTTFIDIKKAQTGDDVYAQGKQVSVIGFPHGVNVALVGGKGDDTVIENQIQSGAITQNRGTIEFAHNAPTYGGASGSPVLDECGRLIGVHHAGLSQSGSHGFNMAIKVIHLIELLK